MGLGAELERYHRYQGLRATGMGRELELEWPAHPVYPQHGYVVRRRELDGFVAANAEAAGARLLQGHEARAPADRAGLRARRRRAADRRLARRDPRRVHDRRRRRQQPLRPGARHVPHPRVAVRHGDPHVLAVAEARRAVDRVGARREGPQRQPDARVRLDLPRRRRHREHRRRAAVDVPRLQERQHDAPARRLRPPDRRPLGDRRRPPGGPAGQRAHPDGRLRRPEGRGRRTSSSATPPAASTRSTARASTTPTRRPAWPPT